MYTFELFSVVDDKFGFNILFFDNIIIQQVYKPDVSGFEYMTEQEAISMANVILKRLEVA